MGQFSMQIIQQSGSVFGANQQPHIRKTILPSIRILKWPDIRIPRQAAQPCVSDRKAAKRPVKILGRRI
jgi:hypothetical protein